MDDDEADDDTSEDQWLALELPPWLLEASVEALDESDMGHAVCVCVVFVFVGRAGDYVVCVARCVSSNSLKVEVLWVRFRGCTVHCAGRSVHSKGTILLANVKCEPYSVWC